MKPGYDEAKLARLMEEAGVDLILAHTPHNVRYLTGGYYFHFRERVAAIGPSQYLPFVGIPRDNPENAFQVAWRVEASPRNEVDTWIPDVIYTKARGTVGAAETAAEAIRKRGLAGGTIAVERAFMPVDAMEALARELRAARFVDSLGVMEELRAVKREDELEIFRRAALADSEAIQAGFREGARGVTTRRIEQRVEEEMVRRGLHFHYAFTAAGPGMRREPSDKIWERGEILHIDAGGSEAGYMSDICRMGVRGEPSASGRGVAQGVPPRGRRLPGRHPRRRELRRRSRAGAPGVRGHRLRRYGDFRGARHRDGATGAAALRPRGGARARGGHGGVGGVRHPPRGSRPRED